MMPSEMKIIDIDFAIQNSLNKALLQYLELLQREAMRPEGYPQVHGLSNNHNPFIPCIVNGVGVFDPWNLV